MVSNTGGFGIGKWLLIGIGVAFAAVLSSCASSIEVGDKCEGLEMIGYFPPVSQQDLDDIKAIGFTKCAKYLENEGLIT